MDDTDASDRLLKLELRLAQLDARERCKMDFLAFVKYMWPEFISGRHHQIMAEKFQQIVEGKLSRLIINLAPRHALTLDTPLLTTRGWTTMADIRPGDSVFGPDGKPTKVLAKSAVFEDRQLYRVTTNDGAVVMCDGEHRWRVRINRKTRRWTTYTTEELLVRDHGGFVRKYSNGTIEHIPDAGISEPRAAMIPSTAAVELPEQKLMVDPYVLGLWLGDGNSRQAIITCHDDDAAHIRPEIERRGYTTTDQGTKMTFGILELKVKLRELGVLGSKHIPAQYLLGAVQQRRDLLKGLMDSDGTVSKKGQCYFCQKDEGLIWQVRELLWSLGIRNTLGHTPAMLNGRQYGLSNKITFYDNDCFFLPRKRQRTKATVRGRFVRVEKLPFTGKTQCVKVDREDEMFLAGHGLVATMNTKSEFASFLLPAWFIGKFPRKKIIQATHTADLATGFGRKTKNLIDSDDFREVFPDVLLASDAKASGRWSTNDGGEYYALGVGGAMAGRGADLCHPFGTLVEVNGQPTKIEDVQVGDSISTHFGRQRITRKLLTMHEQSVTLNCGLVSSVEHKYLVRRGASEEWREAHVLIPGDRLLTTTLWRRAWTGTNHLLRSLREKRGVAC